MPCPTSTTHKTVKTSTSTTTKPAIRPDRSLGRSARPHTTSTAAPAPSTADGISHGFRRPMMPAASPALTPIHSSRPAPQVRASTTITAAASAGTTPRMTSGAIRRTGR